MTADEVIKNTYVVLKGKSQLKAPTQTDEKYKIYLLQLNNALGRYSSDTENQWLDLHVKLTLQMQNGESLLPNNFSYITNDVHVNGRVVPCIELSRKNQLTGAHIAGHPKKLYLNNELSNYSGDVSVEYQMEHPNVTSGSDVVVCSNYRWLFYEIASEMARNDPEKDEEYPNLVQIAQREYQIMSHKNKVGSTGGLPKVKILLKRSGKTW